MEYRKLPYVITGTGRSGTTFLAHAFLNGGYDLGKVDTEKIGKGSRPVGGGLECSDFLKINNLLLNRMRKGQAIEEIALELESVFHDRFPAVIKDPLYALTGPIWHAAGYRPKHVFICMRKLQPTRKSYRKAFGNDTYIHFNIEGVYALLEECTRLDIPVTPIAFPRIGQDQHYAQKVLAPFFSDPWAVVQQTWNDELPQEQTDEKAEERLIVSALPDAPCAQ